MQMREPLLYGSNKASARPAYNFIESVAHLPRGIKKAIMLAADVVMIPAALYSAMTLHLGTFDHYRQTGALPYVGAVIIALPIFVRLGLYRAIVRYIGGKAIRAVVFGVTLSALLMLALDLAFAPRVVPFAALGIYWAWAHLCGRQPCDRPTHVFFVC